MSDGESGGGGRATPRVLLVEDDETLLRHLAQTLSNEYVVEAVRDGEQALKAVLRHRPDIVVADVVLPGLDGVELVRTLRSTPSTQTIPVLLASGKAPEELRIEGFEVGADSYLAKPYSLRELRARIRSMLQGAQLRRDAARREAREQAERAATIERAVLLESITDAFYALDRQWRFTYVNQRALDHFQKEREALLGKVIWQVFPMLVDTTFEEHYERAVHEQRSIAFEAHSPILNHWIEVHAYPTPQGLAVNFRDIERRKRAEEERQTTLVQLRGRERRLDLATEVAELGIFVWDIQADRVTSENLRSYEIFGRTREDPPLSGRDFLERFLHPTDREAFERQLAASLQSGAPLRVTCRVRRQNDAAWRWLEIIGSIEVAADRSPSHLVGVLNDVTEQRRAEEAVRESEERFRMLAEAVPALVFVTDAKGLYVYTNAQYHAFVGLPAEDLLGEGWMRTLHPDDKERAAATWQRAVATGGPYEAEYRFRRLDGVYRWFLVRGDAVRGINGQISAWYGSCTDIDEAKRTAEALTDEKRTLEVLNELGRAVAADLDLERVVQAVTDAATTLSSAAFGAFFYNVLNKDGESYTLYALSGVPREAFAQFPMPRNTAVFGPTFRGESVVRSDDITRDPRYGRNSPHRGMPEGHLPVRSYLAVPVVSRSGGVLGGLFFGHPEVGVFSERSERLVVGIAAQAAIAIDNAHLYQAAQRELAERRRVEAALRDSDLALREADRRKDEFLAVLAHELRNPLAPIRNGLHITRLRAAADPALQKVVSMMDRQMTHVVRLVDDLLDISRITRGKLELRRQRVLLTDVTASAVDASRVIIEAYGHELIVDSRADDLMIDGDPDRLAQVLSNLLSNSAKYTNRGGRITLTLDREGDEAVVTVQDNGIGIPTQALEDIFQMFSQVGLNPSSHAREGLGIGLSLTRTLVEMHDGSITAFSAGPGSGSTFTVRLPLAKSHGSAETPAIDIAATHEQSRDNELKERRILIADDNADAATSLAMLLQIDGHEVRVVSDGQEAVEQARQFSPEIIFMDIGMPRVDGLEATRRIRALPQGQGPLIVALTGWGQTFDRERTSEAGMDHHLVKPVSREDIEAVVTMHTRTLGRVANIR